MSEADTDLIGRLRDRREQFCFVGGSEFALLLAATLERGTHTPPADIEAEKPVDAC